MNLPYNFQMPPNFTSERLNMPPRSPDLSYQPMERMPPAEPTTETFGSLELSDPYMRDLMRMYYVPPRPPPQLSFEMLNSRYPILLPAEPTTPESSYMRDLIRNYRPTPTQQIQRSFPTTVPTSGNAFFTL